MAHEIHERDDNIINVKFTGDQFYQDLISAADDLEKIINRKDPSVPVVIMIDLNLFGKHNMGTRLAGLEFLKRLNYQRMVVHGGDKFTRGVAKFVIAVSGLQKVKWVSSEEEAIKWLASHDHQPSKQDQ
jgi:hypothetical protein